MPPPCPPSSRVVDGSDGAAGQVDVKVTRRAGAKTWTWLECSSIAVGSYRLRHVEAV